MSPLGARFDEALARLDLPAGPALVAVSGGPDSLALLHLLVRSPVASPLALTVAHADHGIHAGSGEVAAAVEQAAASLGRPALTARLNLGADCSETVAREARYRWLHQEAAQRGALILTAHHRDDQVETVLMRFLNGSGPAGLAGMAARSGRVARPLLGFGRDELRSWLVGEGLAFWEDPANLDPRHLRGWVRGGLLPLLEGRDAAVRQRVLRVADGARTDRAAWDAVLEVLPLRPERVSDGISIASGPLRGYDTPLALCLVTAAARRAGLSLGGRRAARVIALNQAGRTGARIELGGGWIAELARGRLMVVRPDPGPLGGLVLDGPGGATHLGPWALRWQTVPAAPSRRDGWTAWVIPGAYHVAPWGAGDRIRPLGGTGSRPVVRCMQDAGVPRHRRAGWPVLRREDEVIWVPGVCRAAAAVPPEGAEAMRIDVEHT